jgi:hypothetical protein
MPARDPLDDLEPEPDEGPDEAPDVPPGSPGGPIPAGAPAAASGPGTVGIVADVVRRAVLTGVGALFLTEEGARKVAREWKLPKELAGFLVQQAAGAKDEVLRVVGQEMRRFFESETFRRELVRILGSMVVEVSAEVRLSEAAPGAPGRTSVRVRRKRPGRRAKPRAGGRRGAGADARDGGGGREG